MNGERTTLPEGVKATSGGTFDRDAPQIKFIASGPEMVLNSQYQNVLVAVNELEGKKSRETLERMLDEGRTVMLDSGIFNLAMNHVRAHGTSHDEALQMAPDEIDGFAQLWDLFGEIATTYADRLWGVVELDQGGVTHKPATRARIESEFGITPIPVYHPLLDGWDYYDTLAQNYDRICFGNLVQAASPTRTRLIHTAYERARQYPYLWTHLLGVYPSPMTNALPMRGSMDSSSWLTPVRWGASWRGWSMFHHFSHYPKSMWSHKGSQGEAYDKHAQVRVCAQTVHAAQLTLDAMKEDTHAPLD